MTRNRMSLAAILSAAAALVVPACSSHVSAGSSPNTPPVPGRTTDEVLKAPDGRARSYRVHVPAGVRPGTAGHPVPLVLAFHGGVGSGKQFESTSGFSRLADAEGFIVVYPDGIGAGPRNRIARTWNGGGCCGPAQKQGVDDVGFVRTLIDTIEGQFPIDRSRVFAVGHSNGGIMSYRLACELSDRIVAIGVQSTTLEMPSCSPTHPVSVLHIHGTADHNIPIGGGRGDQSLSQTDFRPPLDGAKTLAAADGCDPTPTTTSDPTNPDLSIRRWTSCRSGTEVRFVTVAGASHAWMGHPEASFLANKSYKGIDSTKVIWQFLAAHPRKA